MPANSKNFWKLQPIRVAAMNERFSHRQQVFGVIHVSSFLHIFTAALLNMMLLEETATFYSEGGGGNIFFITICVIKDRLCGLVVRVSGYRYRDLGFDSRRYQIF